MEVDVRTEVVIERPIAIVAAYAADPGNVSAWYANIRSVEWRTDPPLALGTRVAFVARFLGRRLVYTYQVVAFAPGERLVMRTDDGPFPMETTYEWTPVGEGATRMVLRNRGTPSGFARVTASAMRRAIRRANVKDLAALKAILESDSTG